MARVGFEHAASWVVTSVQYRQVTRCKVSKVM